MRHARGRFLPILAAVLFTAIALVPAAGWAAAPEDPCLRPPAQLFESQQVTGSGPWTHVQNIEHHRGLVYRDIRAAGWPFLRSFYVSHFELTFDFEGLTVSQIVRYCSGDDQWRDSDWDSDRAVYTWQYGHSIRDGAVQGDFTVTYETRYGQTGKPCAGRDGFLSSSFTRKCARWVPRVSYDWLPQPRADGLPIARLKSVRAFFRLDYGNAAITLVKDPDSAVPAGLAAGVHPIVVNETSFVAVSEGKPGRYDNIHTAYPINGRRTVVVPGCRAYGYDCTHLHWRWGGTDTPPLDPLEDPFTGQKFPRAQPGMPYLAKGQTIEVFVTADNGDGDVAEPRDLVNSEVLATAEVCKSRFTETLDGVANTKLTEVKRPVVVWYVAKSKRAEDTFFRHGFFALESLQLFRDWNKLSFLVDNFYEWQRQGCDPVVGVTAQTVRKATQ